MTKRTFSLKQQTAFAELSGDYNLLHIDPISARRTLFGGPVVHGIHAVLWSLDKWFENNPTRSSIRSIKAVFPHPIRVGDEVRVTYEKEDEEHLRIEVYSGRSLATIINIEWGIAEKSEVQFIADRFPEKRELRSLSGSDITGLSGTVDLCLNRHATENMFPHLITYASLAQIAVLLNTSRLVGVECPGAYSMYSELNLQKNDASDCRNIEYEVIKFDRRFNLVFIKVNAPAMSGIIKAFVRPPHHNQAGFTRLKEHIKDNEFKAQRALVIGGSRGLGEVASKLLAAGAADVRITYNQGKKNAQEIIEEINESGGTAAGIPFNVLNPDRDVLNTILNNWRPTHLYYFATPFIFIGTKGTFSPEIFNKFCEYYIKGFLDTLNCFSNPDLEGVYCPSTVAIDELPLDMGEYAAAKTAVETLCSFLEKSRKNIIIQRPRLPRMSTDQTVSLLPVKNTDPVPLLIEHLRNLRDSSAKKGHIG